MTVNYLKLFMGKAHKDKGGIPPRAAHSIIAEDSGISGEDKEEQIPETTSDKPSERKQYRDAGPRCTECGWSKS
jgi:hypothetical protein